MSHRSLKRRMIRNWPGAQAHRRRMAERYLRDMAEFYNMLANENPTGYPTGQEPWQPLGHTGL
jgi:hypothetical protein